MPLALLPGDVIAVNTGNGLGSEAIRLGESLENEANLDNHIAIVHHMDENGNWWVIEGRPGGVGYRDLKAYTESPQAPYLYTTAEMPKTNAQRNFIVDKSKAMLGTPYDWYAIADDAAKALLRRNIIWGMKDFGDLAPAMVVCSSFAVWLYHHAGLAYPNQHGERWTTPADWTEFILRKAWL